MRESWILQKPLKPQSRHRLNKSFVRNHLNNQRPQDLFRISSQVKMTQEDSFSTCFRPVSGFLRKALTADAVFIILRVFIRIG